MPNIPVLPGGTGLTYVQVYSSQTPDGQCGGCPHMHLVCTELYYTIRGSGAVEFISYENGFQRVPLTPGKVLYFTPGVIHRLINESGDLEVLVLMENSGLPEMGDAVMTFPREYLSNSQAYTSVQTIVDHDAYTATTAAAQSMTEAEAMRNLAVAGFMHLAEGFHISLAEGRTRLTDFHNAATDLVRPMVNHWSEVIAAGSATAQQRTQEALTNIAQGHARQLTQGEVIQVPEADPAQPNLSMCGLMWPFLPKGVVFDSPTLAEATHQSG